MKKILFILLLFINFKLLFAFEMILIPEINYVRKGNSENFQLVTINSFYMSEDDITLNDWSEYLFESRKSNSVWKAKYFKDDFSLNDQIDYMKFKMSSFGTIDEADITINIEGPIYWISFIEAVKYCNFLSEQEDLQPCYSISTNEYGTEKISWNINATGYRLPTLAELTYAFHAGTKDRKSPYYDLNRCARTLYKERPNDWGIDQFDWCRIEDCFERAMFSNDIKSDDGRFPVVLCKPQETTDTLYWSESETRYHVWFMISCRCYHAMKIGKSCGGDFGPQTRLVVGPDLVSEWKAKHGKK